MVVPPTAISHSTRQQVLRFVLLVICRLPPTEVNVGKDESKFTRPELAVSVKFPPIELKLPAFILSAARVKIILPPTVVSELISMFAVVLMLLATVLFMVKFPPTLTRFVKSMALNPVPLFCIVKFPTTLDRPISRKDKEVFPVTLTFAVVPLKGPISILLRLVLLPIVKLPDTVTVPPINRLLISLFETFSEPPMDNPGPAEKLKALPVLTKVTSLTTPLRALKYTVHEDRLLLELLFMMMLPPTELRLDSIILDTPVPLFWIVRLLVIPAKFPKLIVLDKGAPEPLFNIVTPFIVPANVGKAIVVALLLYCTDKEPPIDVSIEKVMFVSAGLGAKEVPIVTDPPTELSEPKGVVRSLTVAPFTPIRRITRLPVILFNTPLSPSRSLIGAPAPGRSSIVKLVMVPPAPEMVAMAAATLLVHPDWQLMVTV